MLEKLLEQLCKKNSINTKRFKAANNETLKRNSLAVDSQRNVFKDNWNGSNDEHALIKTHPFVIVCKAFHLTKYYHDEQEMKCLPFSRQYDDTKINFDSHLQQTFEKRCGNEERHELPNIFYYDKQLSLSFTNHIKFISNEFN